MRTPVDPTSVSTDQSALRPVGPESLSASSLFAGWLDDLMRQRRLSNRRLARRTSLDHSTISRVRRGLMLPSLETAHELAAALGSSFVVGRPTAYPRPEPLIPQPRSVP